jgi:hypothetical protein
VVFVLDCGCYNDAMTIRLDLAAARALQIAAQGLAAAPERPATRHDLLTAIRRMGVLQIDTIHVVARSPYLVLWSRLGAYEPHWLDELLAEGAIFEYWSHEASFLPIEDYPLYRRLMLDGQRRAVRYAHAWLREHQATADHMLELIRERGAVRSADFARTDGRRGSWWDWKHEKLALEMLFSLGELMIARRERFQRVYDLRERVLAGWDDRAAPPFADVLRALVLRAVRALGVAPARWIADYFRTDKRATNPIPAALAAEGELLVAAVEGWDEPAYIHPENRALAQAAADGMLRPSRTVILSPFDPLVWDRARASALFGFDYRIECYTPAPQRRYGYFTLPILHRDALIGRLDAKAHRRDGVFEVKSLHLEPGIDLDETLAAELSATLHSCAAWHWTPEVVVRFTDPPEAAAPLAAALSAVAGSNKTPTQAV